MFSRASYFCVLSLVMGVSTPAVSFADFEVKPVPFNAQNFTGNVSAPKEETVNIETIDDIEPAAGTKSPEPYYMVTINSIPVDQETDVQDASMPATPSAAASPAPASTPATLINAGQKVKITVTGESDLTAIYTVKPDGSIDFPMLGKVTLANLSPEAAMEQLTASLKDGYIIDPKVSLQIMTADPIFVLGDVLKPGAPIYTETISIASAIRSAGGYEKTAKQNNFQVLRTNDPDIGLFSSTKDSEVLESGDVLIVKGY